MININVQSHIRTSKTVALGCVDTPEKRWHQKEPEKRVQALAALYLSAHHAGASPRRRLLWSGPQVQVLAPRETAPWPLWIRLPHDHLAKLRLRLVSMGTKGKSRPRLTTMMKIYLGSKSRKKPQAQRVVNGGGRENRRRGEGKGGGPPRLFQCLQLLFIAVPDDLKIIRWGRGSLGVRVHGAIYEAFPFLGGQSCDHMSLCFSKLHVCFCSFCQTKSIQLVATFKES